MGKASNCLCCGEENHTVLACPDVEEIEFFQDGNTKRIKKRTRSDKDIDVPNTSPEVPPWVRAEYTTKLASVTSIDARSARTVNKLWDVIKGS